MNNAFLRIITWNANGLNQRARELEVFMLTNNIDIALISETHFSNKNHIKIRGYCAYWTTHPSERARGGTAILIKQNIQHYLQEEVRQPYIQATIISVQNNGAELNIGAIYCPPCHTITQQQYMNLFNKLGPRFIIGGDFNVKHTAWGARIITPGKGKELLSAINISKCEHHSAREPTYWPTDKNRMPDLLDFFISKGISSTYMKIENLCDLTSDHTPVLLTLGTSVIRRTKKLNLTNKHTNWAIFREKLDSRIKLNVKLKTIEDLELEAQRFIKQIHIAASQATPVAQERPEQEVNYPSEIRDMIRKRRKARRVWQRTRNPADKRNFNRISNQTNHRIRDFKQTCFENYLGGLGPEADRDYSLWKAARRFKRPAVQVPPIKNAQGQWVRKNDEKAELFAQHLATVFQPNDIHSTVILTSDYQTEVDMKLVSPMEVAQEIDNNLNPKKAPGIDEISPSLFKELPRKAIIMLTYLFNACLRLKCIPECFKMAQIIMIKKPDKPAEQVASYRPISLLPMISKLFEKLLLKRIKPFIIIPDFQFGFRSYHSTIDQVHRVTTVIERALEEKKYCSAVFLDVSQAFDRVWHQGLIYKMNKMLPHNYCQLLESYLSGRKFRVAHDGAFSAFYPIAAGVPQGSVIGPLLYLLYTADIPTTEKTVLGTFADDTVIMATDTSQVKATESLQVAIDKISQWTRDWKIKLNGTKSVHVTYALRQRNSNLHIYLDGVKIPQAESARYLGLHLDARLNWKHHVRQKAEQIRIKTREMYWLIGRHSKLNLKSKRLIYQSIIKPIWTYGVQLWGCTRLSNQMIIQRSQNKFLRLITNAYRYVTNEELHKDLAIKWVSEVISEHAVNHEKRLLRHTNVEAIQLLDNSQEPRRLKRVKPYDLICKLNC